jgi:hypothetical protein
LGGRLGEGVDIPSSEGEMGLSGVCGIGRVRALLV